MESANSLLKSATLVLNLGDHHRTEAKLSQVCNNNRKQQEILTKILKEQDTA